MRKWNRGSYTHAIIFYGDKYKYQVSKLTGGEDHEGVSKEETRIRMMRRDLERWRYLDGNPIEEATTYDDMIMILRHLTPPDWFLA